MGSSRVPLDLYCASKIWEQLSHYTSTCVLQFKSEIDRANILTITCLWSIVTITDRQYFNQIPTKYTGNIFNIIHTHTNLQNNLQILH